MIEINEGMFPLKIKSMCSFTPLLVDLKRAQGKRIGTNSVVYGFIKFQRKALINVEISCLTDENAGQTLYIGAARSR